MGLLEVCLRWWALNRGWAAWVGLALALAAAALFSATSSKGPQGGRGGQGRGGARGGGEGGGGGEGEGGGGARVGAAGAARRRGGAAAARGQPGPTRARRVVLVSLLGTVLEQRTPEELAEEQSVAEGAPQALGRLLAAGCEVYLVARVADDTTEHIVRALLESLGVSANAELLFCETSVGMSSMARQLEAYAVLGADAAVAETLRRFIPQLLLVGPKAALPAPLQGARNVVACDSFDAAVDALCG